MMIRSEFFKCMLLLVTICIFSECKKRVENEVTTKDQTTLKALCGPKITDLETEPGKDGKLTPLFEGSGCLRV